MRTNMSLRVKRLIAYVYDLCYRIGLYVQIRLLRVNQIFIQRLGDSPTWWWQSCWMLSDSSDVSMTVVIDAIWFVRSCDDLRHCVTVLIGCPRGSVRRLRTSGIFSTTILSSDWTILVIRSSGFCRGLLLVYLAMERLILTLDRLLDDKHLVNLVE